MPRLCPNPFGVSTQFNRLQAISGLILRGADIVIDTKAILAVLQAVVEATMQSVLCARQCRC